MLTSSRFCNLSYSNIAQRDLIVLCIFSIARLNTNSDSSRLRIVCSTTNSACTPPKSLISSLFDSPENIYTDCLGLSCTTSMKIAVGMPLIVFAQMILVVVFWMIMYSSAFMSTFEYPNILLLVAALLLLLVLFLSISASAGDRLSKLTDSNCARVAKDDEEDDGDIGDNAGKHGEGDLRGNVFEDRGEVPVEVHCLWPYT